MWMSPRHSLYHAWLQARRFSGGQSSFTRLASVWHGFLHPAQHTDKAPHQVVVHRRSLSRTPHKADEAEAVKWVAIQQVVTIPGWVTGGEGVRKPVIMRHQGREQVTSWLQHRVLGIALVFNQPSMAATKSRRRAIDISGVPRCRVAAWSEKAFPTKSGSSGCC